MLHRLRKCFLMLAVCLVLSGCTTALIAGAAGAAGALIVAGASH